MVSCYVFLQIIMELLYCYNLNLYNFFELMFLTFFTHPPWDVTDKSENKGETGYLPASPFEKDPHRNWVFVCTHYTTDCVNSPQNTCIARN